MMQQHFHAPKGFPMPATAHPDSKAAERGMKLTCGFEMMFAASVGYTAPPTVEVGGGAEEGLEGRARGGAEGVPGWRAYNGSLVRNGYFAGRISIM